MSHLLQTSETVSRTMISYSKHGMCQGAYCVTNISRRASSSFSVIKKIRMRHSQLTPEIVTPGTEPNNGPQDQGSMHSKVRYDNQYHSLGLRS
jgi:hypothetical protein